MRTWHFAVWFITVMAGALYTIIQTGPDTAGENLCKLVKKVVPSITDQCVPSFGSWGATIILIIGVIFGLLVLWDVFTWIQGRRQNRPKRTPQKSINVMESIWRLSKCSAWGKWQIAMDAAQDGPNSEENRLHLSEQVFRQAAEDGLISIRGRQKNSVDYQELSRDFWRVVYFELQRDPQTIWRANLKVRAGAIVKLPEYDDFVVDKQQFDATWAERDLRYIWPITKLRIKALFRKMPDKPALPTPSSSPNQDEQAAAIPVEIPAGSVVEITVTNLAPDGWDKLFVVGDEGKSIWLSFLPDTGSPKGDALLLIVYAHKVLFNCQEVSISGAHSAVQKTIDNAPRRSYAPEATGSGWFSLIYAAQAAQLASSGSRDNYAESQIGSNLTRVGLARGGYYKITQNGEQRAASLAHDLIRRA